MQREPQYMNTLTHCLKGNTIEEARSRNTIMWLNCTTTGPNCGQGGNATAIACRQSYAQ